MTLNQVFKNLRRQGRTPEQQEAATKSYAHNITVVSRPVLRRAAFLAAMESTNLQYGGERRSLRRLWARREAKRLLHASKA